MTREEAETYVKVWCPYDRAAEIIEALSKPAGKGEWVPIKTRPLTEAELEKILTEGSDGSLTRQKEDKK